MCLQPFRPHSWASPATPVASACTRRTTPSTPSWTTGLDCHDPRGTVRVPGRCDGMLNIRASGIGPIDIYDIIARDVPEVAMAMAVDADAPDEPGGKRLLLFVVLRPGTSLDRTLTFRIKKELKAGGL